LLTQLFGQVLQSNLIAIFIPVGEEELAIEITNKISMIPEYQAYVYENA
jgi:hypothetical protein